MRKAVHIGLVAAIGGVVLLMISCGPARIVVSDSMVPAIYPGDAIWLRPVSEPIEPGMIVSYRYQDKLITHRVVAREGDLLRTQGDNNQKPDSWEVPVSNVVGTLAFHVRYLGYLLSFLQRPAGWVLFVVVPALGLVLFEVQTILSVLRSENSDSSDESAADKLLVVEEDG